MTGPQRAALRMLADEPRRTSKHNGHGAIGGRTAACLARLGYAHRVSDTVYITIAGRKALVDAEKTGF